VARDLDAPRMFGTVFTRILAGYLLAALGLALFQEEVVALLGGAPYASASAVVAPVLLAYFCQSAASLMDAGLYVRRRTGLKLGVTLVTTAVMFVLYAVLIPRYGSRGAAFATLIGFVFLAVCTWAVTQRVFPVRYEWSRLSALLSLAVGLWLVSRLLPAEPWSWPVKVALWLLGPIVVWCMGLMSHREKEHVRALSSEVRLRLLNGLMWSRKYQPGAPATGEESPSLALRAGKEATRMR
jgi:O-antigen/teichoic acid export membrane protein